MKRVQHLAFGMAALLFVLTSCQQEAHRDVTPPVTENQVADISTSQVESAIAETGRASSGTCNPNAYTVILESKTAVAGGWEWIWSVQNPNPGNGNNGTVQDLSHWGMTFGACFAPSSMVSAAYSGNGSTWTSFVPSYQADPSQSCMSLPVLKFDFGTQGTAKSYYKLVVNADYATGSTSAYYKSGGNTGCCTFTFTGIACEEAEGPR
jgi:hypothetical protein